MVRKKNIQDSLRVPMHDDLYKLCEEHTSIADLHKSFEE